jgi:hypothetical protein
MDSARGSKRSNEQFEDALEQARRTTVPVAAMQHPWETNSWLRQTMPRSSKPVDFMTNVMNRVLTTRLVMPPLLPELSKDPVPVRAQDNKYGEALRRMLKTRVKAKVKDDDSLRLHALGRWRTIIGQGPDASWCFDRQCLTPSPQVRLSCAGSLKMHWHQGAQTPC